MLSAGLSYLNKSTKLTLLVLTFTSTYFTARKQEKPLALAVLQCPSYHPSPPLFQGQTGSPTVLWKHFSLMSNKQKHKNTCKNKLVTEDSYTHY